MQTNETTISITVDKSHLITIGEKLYAESIELIRELVNNAYDADASEVYVAITEERITVSDDGTGMNMAGLRQYFTMHLARLFTQEIALMKDPKDARRAFANQSNLLRESFVGE